VGRNPFACDGKSKKPQSGNRLVEKYCDVAIVHGLTLMCLALSVNHPKHFERVRLQSGTASCEDGQLSEASLEETAMPWPCK